VRNTKNAVRFASENMIIIVVLLFFIVLSLSVNNFFTLANIINILVSGSIIGIMAAALAPLIISGGIDLSIGSLMGLGGMISIALLHDSYGSTGFMKSIFNMPWPVAIFIGILIPSLIGLINGLIVVNLNINPFIITLGMSMIVRGLTYLFGDFAVQQIGRGTVVVVTNPVYKAIGTGKIFNLIPIPVLVFFGAILIFGFVLERMPYGRALYAIGGNQEIARLSGIKVRKCRIAAHIWAAAFAGIAGIVYSCRIMTATPLAGDGYEMDVISACVIGGVSMKGGQGRMWKVLVGVLMISILSNGLNLMNVSSFYQYVVKGVILIVAVAIDSYYKGNLRGSKI
jgi:ribose transport system permease protein